MLWWPVVAPFFHRVSTRSEYYGGGPFVIACGLPMDCQTGLVKESPFGAGQVTPIGAPTSSMRRKPDTGQTWWAKGTVCPVNCLKGTLITAKRPSFWGPPRSRWGFSKAQNAVINRGIYGHPHMAVRGDFGSLAEAAFKSTVRDRCQPAFSF